MVLSMSSLVGSAGNGRKVDNIYKKIVSTFGFRYYYFALIVMSGFPPSRE